MYHFNTLGGEVKMSHRHCKANECENRAANERWGRCWTQQCGGDFDKISEDDFDPSFLTRMGPRYLGVDICLDHVSSSTASNLPFMSRAHSGLLEREPLPVIQAVVSNGMNFNLEATIATTTDAYCLVDGAVSFDSYKEIPAFRVQDGGYAVLCDGGDRIPRLMQMKKSTVRRALVAKIAEKRAPPTPAPPPLIPTAAMKCWTKARNEHQAYEKGYLGIFDAKSNEELDPVATPAQVYGKLKDDVVTEKALKDKIRRYLVAFAWADDLIFATPKPVIMPPVEKGDIFSFGPEGQDVGLFDLFKEED